MFILIYLTVCFKMQSFFFFFAIFLACVQNVTWRSVEARRDPTFMTEVNVDRSKPCRAVVLYCRRLLAVSVLKGQFSLKSEICLFFPRIPAVLFTHLDCFGLSCSADVAKTRRINSITCDGTIYVLLISGLSCFFKVVLSSGLN